MPGDILHFYILLTWNSLTRELEGAVKGKESEFIPEVPEI